MNETIDKLAIEIDTESGNATKGIDSLINTLNKLQTSLGKSTESARKFLKSYQDISNLKSKDLSVNVKTSTSKASKVAKAASDETVEKSTSKNLPATTTSGTLSTDVSDEGPLKVMTTLEYLSKKFEVFKAKLKNTEFGKAFDKLNDGLNYLNRNAGKASSNVDKIGSSTNRTSNSMLKLSKNMIKLPFSLLVSGAKKGIGAFQSLKKGVSSAANSIGKAINNITKRIGMISIALLGVRGLFTATRKAVSEYMNYDTELSKTLQNNWAVLGSLIAPILERIISLFSKAVAYIAAFIKALTGIDLVAKANSKAIKGMGASAKKAKSDLGNLASFDELNTVTFDKGSDTGGSGKSLDPLTVEEIDTSPIDRFIEYLKSQDWYGMGFALGEKFNEGLRSINFDWLTEKAAEWGKNFGDFFNGLTDGIDWNLLGEKIAGGLNTVMAFVNTFYDTYNFDNLGVGIAKGLNGAINKVDWKGIGQFFANKIQAILETADGFLRTFDFASFGTGLSEGVMSWFNSIDWTLIGPILENGLSGAIDTLISFIDGIDFADIATKLSNGLISAFKGLGNAIKKYNWAEIGDKIYNAFKDFIKNVDWGELGNSIFNFLGSAIGAAFLAIGTVISEVIDDIKDYFKKYIDEANFGDDGTNIIMGVLTGIVDALKNIGKWIWNHIFTPFINGFKDAFGIHSPSKVMAEMGGYIIDGLKNGLKGIWEKVKSIFIDLKDRIVEKFKETWNKIKEVFNIDNIKNHFNNIVSGIKNVFNTVTAPIKKAFSNAWDGIKSIFGAVKDWFAEHVTNPIKNAFSSMWDGIKGILNLLIDGINTLIKGINKIQFDVPDWVPKIGGKKWGFNIKEIPKLATGTNEIITEGIYHLHQGEAVVPKKYNPAVNNQLYDESNEKVVEGINRLISVVQELEMTNIVNVGDDQLYKKTTNYIRRQNNIYGTSVI